MPYARAAGFLAALMLGLCAAVPVRAADSSGAPGWSEADSARAGTFRLLSDMGGGSADPDGVLTWAEYLAMLCRVFAADDYWYLNRDRGVTWGAAAWHTARARGFLEAPLPVNAETMWRTPVARQDFALLLSRLLPEEPSPPDAEGAPGILSDAAPPASAASSDGSPEPLPPLTAEHAFFDFPQMDESHREAASRLFAWNLLAVRSDGLFDPGGPVPRRDAAAALLRALDRLDQAHAGEPRTIAVIIQDEQEAVLGSDGAVSAAVGQSLSGLAALLAPAGYKASYMGGGLVSTAVRQYTLRVKPLTEAEAAQREAQTALSRGLLTQEAYDAAGFWLHLKDDNAAKRALLFQDADWGRKQVYESEEEAAAHMTEVQIPVWTLWDGQKSPGTMTLTVHQALAGEVLEIFTEIYQDPEQFPIESVGGFRYRSGTTSEHNNGTAIDINPDANFQVRDGIAETGTHWSPGADPLSIASNGSVVRAFEAHGWTWGGADWAGSDDAAAGYHDYMHFSYRGM